MMSTAKRTILVLHGYSQNANIFSKRLGALRKQCAKNIDLVFLDAPHILQPVDLFGQQQNSAAATYDDLGAPEAAQAESDPLLTPRGWWKSNASRTAAIGLDETLILLRDVLKERKFDGVFGFSQGAALAALLSALLERPNVYPPFLVDGKSPHPPFQFCLSVAGFKPIDPLCDVIFGESYSTPTLHVIGKTDIIVTEERAKTLLEVSSSKKIAEHDGGHFVPSKANWRKYLCEYLQDPTADIPPPGLGGSSSVSASGTTTPVTTNPTTPSLKL